MICWAIESGEMLGSIWICGQITLLGGWRMTGAGRVRGGLGQTWIWTESVVELRLAWREQVGPDPADL